MTINHEIKTPLAVIRGMVEGMIDQVGRYQDRDTYLLEVIKQIDVIEAITKDLTYTLKLEDKKNRNDLVDTHVLENILSRLKEFASTKNVVIQANIKQKQVIMSEELLEIVFTNLVKNSILYTQDKKVSIDTEIIQDEYIITVSNKGHIDHEDTNKLFDSYTRGKHKEEGSGLGLYIVKQICNLYGYEYKIFNNNDRVITKIKIKCH